MFADTNSLFAEAKAAHVVVPKIDRKVRDDARKIREDRYVEALSNGEENPKRYLKEGYVEMEAMMCKQ